MASDNESASTNRGLRSDSPDPETKDYALQQTMYRIKDPEKSLEFYSKVLGMSLLKKLDFQDMKFSLYFLGYEDTSSRPEDPVERTKWTFKKNGTIELTHNWGSEKDPRFQAYHNGNSEPRGFGHIGIRVDDISKACKRFSDKNVPFVKKPDEGDITSLDCSQLGKLKGIAFIKDPDDYWIEIFDAESITNVAQAAIGAEQE
ncbi:hypothetical protein SSX86_023457 [Deinandra increscens subsp. villosa]|uniref:Lactoylglutathione lyase n=1 Tax=Deinandra increscens subsp. villosa TaxID=3103831 RepID=A0AAP0CKX4_9ASTR